MVRDSKGGDVMNLVAERMGNGVDIYFANEAAAVQRWGGKVYLRKVKMGNVEAMKWLVARRTGASLCCGSSTRLRRNLF